MLELPAPVFDRGNCHGVTELLPLFFSDQADDQERARAVCAGCPVRQECYDAAIARREEHGIWGGSCFPDEWKAARRRLIAQLFEDDDDGPALLTAEGEPLPAVRSA